MGNRSRNFNDWEFRCTCGKCDGTVTDELVDKLQQTRDYFGLPITISSGFRCEDKNIEVGGAPRSYHMQGLACDIDVSDYTSQELYMLLQAIFAVGYTGIGIGKNWIHLDIRPKSKPRYMGIY